MMKFTSLIPVGWLLVVGCPKPVDSASPNPKTDAPTVPSGHGPMRLDADAVVATWNGGKLTYGELYEMRKSTFSKLRREYLTKIYETEQREIEAHIIGELVKAEAAKQGKDEAGYLKEIASKATVDDDSILKFYEANVKQTGEKLEAAKPKIAAFLMNQAQQQAVRAEFSRLAESANVSLDVPVPDETVVQFELAGKPFVGKENAKIKIVEFSDFECPYCSRARTEVHKLVAEFPEDIAVYFLHFPLSMHPNARPAAVAAECAHRQGKFWPMHDRLFDNQQNLDSTGIMDAAKKAGLDTPAFSKCLADPTAAAAVQQDMETAESAGVDATPTFFVNGVPYVKGIPSSDVIKKILASRP